MHKILVLRLSSLGDIILTFPVLRTLRQAYPEGEIVMMVKETFADALATNTDLSRLMLVKSGESLASLVGRTRRERFDAVIDLHGNIRSRVISAFSGSARRVRYRKAMLARRLYVGFRVESSVLRRHTLDRYMETLRRLDPRQPFFNLPLALTGEGPRVLVIQTAFLGDAVLTTPLLGALQEKIPQAAITVLCTPETEEVFRRVPAVRDVVVFDKRSAGPRASVWQLAGELRARQFDLALLPHRSFRSALTAWLAGIPRRIGFSTSQGRWLLTDRVSFEWGVHDVERNLALLGPLGMVPPRATLEMRPDPAALESVRQKLLAAGVRPHDRLIGIHPGSIWPTKRWLPEGFASVGDRLLSEPGTHVLFVGGAKDRQMTEELIARMHKKPLNWVGETDLKALIAAVSCCSGFVTNDSGPMHIAVACGVPTVAVFGPTTKELGFFPYGAGHRVVEKDLPCRPCGLHGAKECPLGHFQCMRLITPDEVYGALQSLLSAPSSARTAP